MLQSFLPHLDLALPKADDSEPPCDSPYLPVLGDTAMQTQYWVEEAAASMNLEAGSGDASTDGPIADSCSDGTANPSTMLRREGVPKTLVRLEIAIKLNSSATFIVVSLEGRVISSSVGSLDFIEFPSPRLVKS